MRARSRAKMGAEKAGVIAQAIDGLRRSGIAGRSVKVGEPAPAFALQSAQGPRVRLTDLLRRGPVVIAFFRGHW
jgi:hypothetical protein